MKNNFAKLAAAILACEFAGVMGSIFTGTSIDLWYPTLSMPALNPPAWVFGPVWTTLYALMGIAAFLVWRNGWKQKKVRKALLVFGIQLILNTLWSVIFFGLHNVALAFVEILMLWLSILLTIVYFYKVSRAAAYLLVPYILWVSFAVYLNMAIWMFN
jgi:tryptophan-rich sensory protein